MPKLLTPLDKAALLAEEFAKVERETNKVEASYERGLLHHLGKALKDNKLALVCLVILCIIIFSSVFAFLSPYDPDEMNVMLKMAPPSAEHWFGTDNYGRDYFTRIAYGGRTTIAIAVLAQVLIVSSGIVTGMLCGYYGKFDMVCMRIMEAIHSLPSMLTVIIIASLIGQGFGSVLIALLLGGIVGVTRNLRGQVLRLRSLEFVEAEKAMGASACRTIFLHILPQTFNYLIIRFSTGLSSAVLTTASLSYLGIGLPPEIPNWGAMISEAQGIMLLYPNLVIWPGICIVLVVFGFSLMGEGLRDILDPKYR